MNENNTHDDLLARDGKNVSDEQKSMAIVNLQAMLQIEDID